MEITYDDDILELQIKKALPGNPTSTKMVVSKNRVCMVIKLSSEDTFESIPDIVLACIPARSVGCIHLRGLTGDMTDTEFNAVGTAVDAALDGKSPERDVRTSRKRIVSRPAKRASVPESRADTSKDAEYAAKLQKMENNIRRNTDSDVYGSAGSTRGESARYDDIGSSIRQYSKTSGTSIRAYNAEMITPDAPRTSHASDIDDRWIEDLAGWSDGCNDDEINWDTWGTNTPRVELPTGYNGVDYGGKSIVKPTSSSTTCSSTSSSSTTTCRSSCSSSCSSSTTGSSAQYADNLEVLSPVQRKQKKHSRAIKRRENLRNQLPKLSVSWLEDVPAAGEWAYTMGSVYVSDVYRALYVVGFTMKQHPEDIPILVRGSQKVVDYVDGIISRLLPEIGAYTKGRFAEQIARVLTALPVGGSVV